MPGTKPPPSMRTFFQSYVSAATDTSDAWVAGAASSAYADPGAAAVSKPAVRVKAATRVAKDLALERTETSSPNRDRRGGGQGRARAWERSHIASRW